MKIDRKYAPILHTGFAENYTEAEMREFVRLVDERGYSGFSAEGKSSSGPTKDIDGWVDGYMRGLEYACRESEERGLDVWIFDEWGYPTGTAAGRTMEGHPEWRSKKLHCAVDMIIEEGETVSITAPKNLLSAAAWHVNRNVFAGPAGGYVNIPVVDGKLTYTADHRRCRLVAASWEYDTTRTVGVFEHDMEDDTQCTLDLLSREAVDRLLEVMHGEYHRRMPEYFGGTIKGFFYDEPFLSFPLPYTFDLIEEFIEKKGYDPTPSLPLLVSGGGGRVRDDWRDVATTMMAEAFFGGMQRWCHEHGVELVGHQDLDHDIRSTNSVSGDFFKNNKYNDAPGVDYIWAQIRPDHTADYPRFAGSFRRMTGKMHATSESFAAVGNCLTPDYMRWAMEYQAIRGIDRFYLMIADPAAAGVAAVAEGERSAAPEGGRGYGTPLDFEHPVSRLFAGDVNRHVAIVNQMLNETAPASSVALYVPRKEISAEYPPARPNRVSLHMPWEWVNDTAEALIYAPVDFEYIWDEMITTLPIDGDGALLMPTGQRITTLVIPAVYALPEDVASRVHEMEARGANVVFISYASEGFVGSKVCTYPRDISKYVGGELRLGGRVSLATRTDSMGKYLFLLNESASSYSGMLAIAEEGYLQKFDFATETWYDTTDEELELCPLELAVYRVAQSPAGVIKEKPTGTAAFPRDWRVTLPDGGVRELPDLCDWREFAGAYSGTLDYEANVTVPRGGRYRLSLGRVCYAASVSFDGGEAVTVPFAPHEVDVTLTEGEHTMKVTVLNSDVTAILGTPEAERLAREVRRFKDIFENDRDYVESGLLGPVFLREYEK